MVVEMESFTGTGSLLRFVVRRDRVRILVWIVGIALLMVIGVASIKGLYPTQADLDAAAVAAKDNAAALAFNGPAQGLNTLGGEVAFNLGATGLVVVALMSLLMMGRLTRGEEEAGRLEMLRSLPIGDRAAPAAAGLVVGGMNVVVGVAIGLCLVATGLSVGGSITFAVAFMLVGMLFGGIALLVAQVTDNTRVVFGVSGTVLGAAFILRAVGDVGDGTLSWLSPIGWAQKARPFAGERWWPLLVLVVGLAATMAAASWLAARRDLGSGLIQPRRGRPRAAPTLCGPFGLAVRLQRGGLIGWSLGILVTSVAYGSIAPSIDSFIGRNRALAEMLAGGGGSLTDAYLARSLQVVALLGTGFAIQSALRLRTEETALRAEPLLATAVSRRRLASSHLVAAVGGVVILLVVTGAAMGISYGIAGGPIDRTPDLLAAALVYAPAMWLMAAIAVALVGLAPRETVAAWAALGFCFLVGFLGDLFRLPESVKDLSPFQQVPQLPAMPVQWLPLVVLVSISLVIVAAALTAFRRRDIG